jgi:hypothetical protein
MNEVNPLVALGNSTILNLRKLLINLRTGKGAQPTEIEVMLSRAIIDMASLLDYIDVLEKKNPDEKDNSVQSLG